MTEPALVGDTVVLSTPEMEEVGVAELVIELSRQGVLTPLGLDLRDPTMPYERFVALCRWLGAVRDLTAFGLGDLYIFGEAVYGDRVYQAIEATGRSKGTLANYVRVSMRVPRSRRRKHLSWSHHEAVAALEPPEQEEYLAKAENERLSVEEFRGIVPRKRALTEKEEEDSVGFSTSGRVRGVVVEELEDASRRVWNEASAQGNVYHVPADAMTRLGVVLGEVE